MFYTFGRSFEQGIRGETPKVRSAVRKEFMNYMLMYTLFAGVTTSSGEEVVPADEFTGFELAMQSLGFSPSRIEQAHSVRSAIKDAQSEFSDRRSQLLQQYFVNVMNGDGNDDVLEDIQTYNHSNPTNAITGEVIVRAIRQKRKARLKKERGIVLSRKDEHLCALERFGDYDPVL